MADILLEEIKIIMADIRQASYTAWLMTVLYGAHPLISKLCVRQEVSVTSAVLVCEVVKVICALLLLAIDGTAKKLFKEWTLAGSVIAAFPAALYALRNMFLEFSYKNLDSLTFVLLHHSQILFIVLFSCIILRTQKLSNQQNRALFLLTVAATLLCIGEGSTKMSSSGSFEPLFYGVVPLLVACALTGLTSAFCEWECQDGTHTRYLMTLEVHIIGSLYLLVFSFISFMFLDGGQGFFYGWTPLTMIPVLLNAVGSILSGRVTSKDWRARQGYAIVSALPFTTLLQFWSGEFPSFYCLCALLLVIISTIIYLKYLYPAIKEEAKKE